MSIFDDARIRKLLAEADSARSLIATRGDPTGEVGRALDSLYRDLGAHLHRLMSDETQDDSLPPGGSLEAGGGFAAPYDATAETETEVELPDPDTGGSFERDGWYTDEVDDDSVPLFESGDLATDEHTDVPESTASVPDSGVVARPAEADAPTPSRDDVEELDRVRLEELVAASRAESGALAELRAVWADRSAVDDAPEWVAPTMEFIDLLGMPEDLLASAAMPEEASRVQWAAGQVDARLPDWPVPVQTALLGMLAARALNLAAHLDVDVGPRRALARLKRYRATHDLPVVAGLAAGPHPERDTWAEDARAWWSLVGPN
jgi:hypothetical protein